MIGVMKDAAEPAPASYGQPVPSGIHLIVELTDAEGLDDAARIEAALRRAVGASGATLLDIHLHRFAPQGVTGVALLAESHITVHTWPEHGYAALDVFMCGASDPWAVVPVLEAAFGGTARVRALSRGPA